MPPLPPPAAVNHLGIADSPSLTADILVAKRVKSDDTAVVEPNFGAVQGTSQNNVAIFGESKAFDAVKGLSHSNAHAGVSAVNDSPTPGGFALWGTCANGVGLAVHGIRPSTIEGGLNVGGATNCTGDHNVGGALNVSGRLKVQGSDLLGVINDLQKQIDGLRTQIATISLTPGPQGPQGPPGPEGPQGPPGPAG